ncbi:hypothetical protein A2331_05635 [Candidatus Falkowbacteria bacterium RIFOXYB2_FULL_34_18]|uniref:Uncharacterized protein n=1 Tax=Candidatus Falkowbacteria bacterium RIFOXYD2_FULL_34_120 TaxID=1798007 RepID=A0A1F5TRZ0_9BACT|nr:MAG: hypothetical protein A2331_05635 [Candidatus Falkowbacteria bacterium RIFOXYB2_FULL_34_18]OGF29810.1 MAG: hypothetical protein A2500_01395 [Candidatus Falkowbacteria bacterium RIFOXYC12_FULL_34_55]OGF37075.1 MAG: hypothetical protein A2466_05810 [Candidatus Falkowbacteria bacterium RIFOXYC2_FULL_34_220]OGF39267.1 MAG: hypothetical protein A2515_01020 [Candidatus Falkowbacteria bacterium RIFOXYD12_FULL_34_57]OGF41371.1 MAG: hypothetical protein A2531_07225 [Candidatus Falkowbacteria bact
MECSKTGKVEFYQDRYTCKGKDDGCGAVYSFLEKDIETTTNGSFGPSDFHFFITCPNCKKLTDVTDLLPVEIKDKLRKNLISRWDAMYN